MHAFNVKGSRVALLLDNRLKAGSYTANWSTRAMPAGTYIVRLKIDGHGEVIRKVAVE
jgi:hypothetical protein